MANYEFFAYSPDALTYDPQIGAFVLDAGYNAIQDRNFIEVSDDAQFFDGDRSFGEQGEDANQVGSVRDGDGNIVATGTIYIEQLAVVQASEGSNILLDRIEVNGQHVGYLPSEPLQPGVQYAYVAGYDVVDSIDGTNTPATCNPYENDTVPSFGPGTMVTTQNGEIPVEWLDTSDKVLTRDHGFQPVLWIGRTKFPSSYFEKFPDGRPIHLPAGSLGDNCPTHDLCLTGDHRVLLRSSIVELMFFSSEVFAPAKAWCDAGLATTIQPQKEFTLTHVLCAAHEVIMANGVWVESMFMGPDTLRRMRADDVQRITELCGRDLDIGKTARPCLARREAAALLIDQERQLSRQQVPILAQSA